VIYFARSDKFGNISLRHLAMERGRLAVPLLSQTDGRHRGQKSRQHAVNLGPDGIRRIFLLAKMRHRHDAARIDGVIGNLQARRDTAIVISRNEGRVIVRHDGDRIRSEPIHCVVRIITPSPQMKNVADSELRQPARSFRYSF